MQPGPTENQACFISAGSGHLTTRIYRSRGGKEEERQRERENGKRGGELCFPKVETLAFRQQWDWNEKQMADCSWCDHQAKQPNCFLLNLHRCCSLVWISPLESLFLKERGSCITAWFMELTNDCVIKERESHGE